MNKKIIKTKLSNGKVINLEKKDKQTFNISNASYMDYDYKHLLSHEEANYLKNFNDEYYGASYTNANVSILQGKIDLSQYTKEQLAEFEKERIKENAKRKKTNEKNTKRKMKILNTVEDYLTNLEQRKQRNLKQSRDNDIFNFYTNITAGNTNNNNLSTKTITKNQARKQTQKTIVNIENHTEVVDNFAEFEKQYMINNYSDFELDEQKENVLEHIKNKTLHICIANLLKDVIDANVKNKNIATQIKDNIDYYLDLHKKQKILKAELFKQFYRINKSLKLFGFKDKEIDIINGIYTEVIHKIYFFKKEIDLE